MVAPLAAAVSAGIGSVFAGLGVFVGIGVFVGRWTCPPCPCPPCPCPWSCGLGVFVGVGVFVAVGV